MHVKQIAQISLKLKFYSTGDRSEMCSISIYKQYTRLIFLRRDNASDARTRVVRRTTLVRDERAPSVVVAKVANVMTQFN